MSPSTKRILCVAGGFLLAWAIVFGAIGAYVQKGGMIEVKVRECCPNGADIHVMVPTALVLVALQFIPDDAFPCDIPEKTSCFSPVVKATLRELSNAPDFVLVQVQGSDERVQIKKEGAKLIVDVESDDESVHVVVPLRLVQTVMNRIDKIARVESMEKVS